MAEDSGPQEPSESRSDAAAAEVRQMTFEQALAELRQIVERLEKGEVQLDEAINAYARGNALKQHCEAKLQEAEAKIERIRVGEDGDAAGTERLDVE